MRSTGPPGPGSGPGADPARADHPVVGESASVPPAAKGEAATVLLAAVGETTAGVAVEAAGAAIPAAVNATQFYHGAGQRGDSRPGGEDGGGAGRSDHGIGHWQRDLGWSRGGALRTSKPGGEDGAAVVVTA